MANSVSHAALPYPIKGARFTLAVPFLDADGDPTDPTTPDTEVSTDGGAFADAAEEITTVSGSNGSGYVTLTGAETNGSVVQIACKVASGPKATLATLYPRVLASVGTGTLSAGSAGGGTLGTLLAYDVTGCFIKTTGGTGGGGTGGASNQVRRIITYNTSTGAFTVAPNWETTPDNTTTYDVLLPEGVTLGMLKALNPATAGRTLVVDSAGLADANAVKVGPTGSGTAQTARDLGASVLLSPGTGTGQVSLSSGAVTVGTNNDKTGYGLSSAAVQAIWDALTSALTTVGSIGKLLVDRIDAAISSRSSHDAAAVVTALGDGSTLTEAGGTGDHLTAVPWNASWDAEVQSEVADALDAAVPGTPTSGSINERIKTMDDAYTATRAGYLDNLSAGAVSTAAALSAAAAEISAILADTGTDGVALSTATKNAIATALLDLADGIEPASAGTERTLREAVRLILAATCGKSSGGGTTFRDLNDTTNRIVGTVDGSFNRTAATYDDT